MMSDIPGAAHESRGPMGGPLAERRPFVELAGLSDTPWRHGGECFPTHLTAEIRIQSLRRFLQKQG
jgi:hypothetical protein